MTGAELRDLRRRRGLTQSALAAVTGLHRNAVAYWERADAVDLGGHAPRLILGALGEAVEFRRTNTRGRAGASWGDSGDPLPVHVTGQAETSNGGSGMHNFATRFARARARHRELASQDIETRKAFRSRCGARTRAGEPCKAPVVAGKRRCRMHGGLSTGAKTKEGRARIAEAQRRRWRRWRKRRGVNLI